MNEDEKQAIEKLDYELTNSYVHNQGISKETLKLFKDIIEKQQKEIKKLKENLKECVHKEKILEKLEELRKEYNNLFTQGLSLDYMNINSHRYDAMKTVLEELLGE